MTYLTIEGKTKTPDATFFLDYGPDNSILLRVRYANKMDRSIDTRVILSISENGLTRFVDCGLEQIDIPINKDECVKLVEEK